MKRMIVCCLLLALLACVPTPEEEVVINKADGTLEEIIHPASVPPETDTASETVGIASPSATAAPMKEHHWEGNFSVAAAMDRLDVFVDATVRYPESGTAPVYRIGYLPPTREELASLLRVFFGDSPVFVADRTKTKAYYKAQMERYIAEQEQETDAAVIAQWQMLLDRAAKDYADAPETRQAIVWDGEASDDVRLMAENGDGTYRYLHVNNQRIGFEDAPDTTQYIRSRTVQRSVETGEEAAALRLCEDVLDTLGIDASLAGVRSTKDSTRAFGSRIEDGYVFWFEPLCGGYPVSAEDRFMGFEEAIAAAGGSSDNEPTYSARYEQESLTVVAVGDHIESFLYTGAPHILGIENEAAALLPYARIRELFESSIGKVLFVNKGEPMKLHVHTVRLAMRRVPIENNQTEFYLLPVWEFLAAVDSGHPQLDASLQYVCVLRLNALDGSIVA